MMLRADRSGETRLALLQRAEPGELSPRFSLGFEVADLNRCDPTPGEFGTSYNAPRQHAEGFDEVVTHDPDGTRFGYSFGRSRDHQKGLRNAIPFHRLLISVNAFKNHAT